MLLVDGVQNFLLTHPFLFSPDTQQQQPDFCFRFQTKTKIIKTPETRKVYELRDGILQTLPQTKPSYGSARCPRINKKKKTGMPNSHSTPSLPGRSLLAAAERLFLPTPPSHLFTWLLAHSPFVNSVPIVARSYRNIYVYISCRSQNMNPTHPLM